MANFDYLDRVEPRSDEPDAPEGVAPEADAGLLFDEGMGEYIAGNWHVALTAFGKATRIAPKYFRAQAAEIDTLIQMDLTAQGESQADFLLERYDANTDIGVARAHGYLHRYRVLSHTRDLDGAEFCYDRAREYLDIAIEKRPDSRTAWLRRLEAMLGRRHRTMMTRAGECFARACAGDDDWATRVMAGAIAYEWEWFHAADAWLTQALAIDWDLASGWYWLGLTRWAMRRRQNGLQCLRRALAIRPDYPAARNALEYASPVRRALSAVAAFAPGNRSRQGDHDGRS